MTCMDCHEHEPVFGHRRCGACIPAAEEREKQRKYAWWRKYYRKVLRKRYGHVKEYKTAKVERTGT